MNEPVQLCYTISDAAKMMNVETHVLRYWEDELNLTIARNAKGHRIYTDDDLKLFKSIQNLKANHISLKEIREQLSPSHPTSDIPATFSGNHLAKKTSSSIESSEKMTQFKSILTNIIKDAMSENSTQLSDDISSRVSDNVRKEIDYLIRQREDEEEARYQRLDETIRMFQKARQETAASKATENRRKKHRFMRKSK
jgi:DNA-binding transcriptional MerR regulator